MIYLLFFILLSSLGILVLFSNNDILKPPIVLIATFSFATFLASLYTPIWNLPMHGVTVGVICFELAVFCVGSLLTEKMYPKSKRYIKRSVTLTYDIANKWIFLLSIIIVIMLFFNYMELLEISFKYTASTDLGIIIHTVITHLQAGDDSFSRWYSYRSIFIKSASYICIYIFIKNLIEGVPFKRFMALLLPIFLFIPYVIFTAGRQQFIYLFIYILVIGIILYQEKYFFDKAVFIKVLGVVSVAFICFLVAFYGTGMLSGKIGINNSNPLRVVAHYAGTNISAFDVFLHTIYPVNSYIGSTTLIDVYAKLHAFSPDIPKFRMYVLEFTYFDGITTNVYTALRRYIQDYGYIGCSLIMFWLGAFYTYFYNYVKYARNSDFSLILFASFYYPVFLLFREERFMTSILSTSSIYVIGSLYIFYLIFGYLNKEGEYKNE